MNNRLLHQSYALMRRLIFLRSMINPITEPCRFAEVNRLCTLSYLRYARRLDSMRNRL
jgi:hypothetical protein